MDTEGGWGDAESGRHVFEFPAGERPAAAITEAVTWFADVDDEVGPLADVVDLDWLSALFGYHRRAGGADRPSESAGDPSLSFEYAGCTVTVEPGRFTIERAAGTRLRGTVESAGD